MNTDLSLDGIISYLTKKHGGNVHEKGIGTITSKSVKDDDPQFGPMVVANLGWVGIFRSKTEPGQWICWDFGQMRIWPTHSTIAGQYMKSWAVDGSIDGSSWTQIDRQTDKEDAVVLRASFTLLMVERFRFIRLTQTCGHNDDSLVLHVVEFFGTLYE
jgi:hypothetical protein